MRCLHVDDVPGGAGLIACLLNTGGQGNPRGVRLDSLAEGFRRRAWDIQVILVVSLQITGGPIGCDLDAAAAVPPHGEHRVQTGSQSGTVHCAWTQRKHVECQLAAVDVAAGSCGCGGDGV